MNILICTGIFPPEPGGPATYSRLLAEELTKRGHKVSVITYASASVIASEARQSQGHEVVSSSETPRNGDFSVIYITRSWFKPWHYYKYFRAVKKYGRDADILYVQDPVSAGYPTLLAARVLKKPFVVKITGDYSWEQAMGRGLTQFLIDEFQNLRTYPRRIQRMREIQIRVCREASAVITPSEYLKKLVMDWGVKEKRIHVIYNAAPKIQHIGREAARSLLKIPSDQFVVVSAGRNVPWKGFEILKEAAEELGKSEIPKLKLFILKNEEHEKVMQYLAAADVFMLNSAYEGTSHLILEAMASGTAVSVSFVGGNPELIGEKEVKFGELFGYNQKDQIKDSMLRLYRHPELRASLTEAAKRRLKEFSVERMIERTESFLNSLIHNL